MLPLPSPAPAAEERFFQKLEGEVEKCNAFTARVVAQLREGLKQLQARARSATDESQRDAMLEVGGGGGGGGAVVVVVGGQAECETSSKQLPVS